MYFHNSPTVKQLKALKRAKAVEMKLQLDKMTRITKRYQPTIDKLEKLRKLELLIENEISTGRLSDEQVQRAHDALASNQNKAARLVRSLLPHFILDDEILY